MKKESTFCCLSVRDFEPKIMIKCTNLQILKKNVRKKVDFFLV